MAGSDYDDDLLALLDEGAGSSKRKKSSSSKPNKRRRQADSDDGSASDMDMSQSDSDAPAPSPKASRGRRVKSAAQVDSSDEDDDEDGPEPTADNPYPLEGIFKDVADRKYVMGLPELQREAIIGERRDEATQRELRKQVAQISKQTDKAAADSDEEEEEEEEDDDDEEYSARASRSRKTVGSSKSKSEGIEKLKKSRADKGKKKEKKADSSDDDYEELARRTSRKSRKDDSDSDMDVSSDEDEKDKKGKGKKKAEPVGPEELATITLTRAKLAELCPAPWFGEWIKNAWVRYSVGEDENRQMQYRVCQVIGTAQGKPYRIDNASTEVYLRLKHGKAERIFSMDAVSNTPFTPREYIRLTRTCETDGVAMPTSKEVSKIREQLAKQNSYTLTEADLSANLKKKPKKLTGAQRKTQLRFERDQAVAANDHDRVAEIDTELANLDKPSGEPRDASAKLNERNRLSNREEVRRAEARSQDERRRQQEALARGVDVKVDASARVKTVPRMNYDSRPQTPNVGTPNGSGHATPVNGGPAASRPVKGKVESNVASRVQLDADLLDF